MIKLRSRRVIGIGCALTAVGVALSVSSCSTPIANRDPRNELFPSVAAPSLAGAEVRVPEDLAGQPAVVLVGYVQNAQFDIDRWLIGLTQLETPARIVELPTIKGLVPGLFAGTIADGMRSGIPGEMWPDVVTLHGEDAAKVVELFGNQGPRNGRVALLDSNGRIVWFHDRGFSPAKLIDLDRRVRDMR